MPFAASDQFAFCVSLYEAIYGEHRFARPEDTTIGELRARMSRPPKPEVRSRLGARLAPILLRGLSIDPAQRWGSMRELLDALEAARRRPGRRWLLAGAAGLAIAAVAFVGWREASSPERACRRAADEMTARWSSRTRDALGAEFAKVGKLGPDAWKLVAPTLDDWTSRWRTLRIEQCEADRNVARPTPVLTARRDCLDRRLGELRGLVEVFGKPDQTVVLYAARAAHSLAPPESCMGALPPTGVAAATPRDPAAVAKTRARVDRAVSLRNVGKLLPAVEEAKAAAAEAKTIGWPPLTAEVQGELGHTLNDMQQTASAADALYHSMWSAEVARDDVSRFRAAIGMFIVSTRRQEYDEAERWMITARAIAGHLPADPSREVDLRYRAVRLAQLKNEFNECVRLGEETLRVAEAANLESSEVTATMIAMARCYSSLEQRDKAVAYLERVLPRAKRLEGDYGMQTASTLTELGKEARAAGKHDKALSYYREALAVREYMGGPEDPECGVVHNNVANVLRDLERYDEARVSLQRALEIYRKAYDPEHPEIARSINGLGRIAMAEGNAAAAEPFFRQGLAIMRKKRKPGHPQLRADVALLAECLLAQRKPEALELFEEALAGTEKDENSTDGDKADARFWAARARVELGIRREGAMEIAEASCKALDQNKEWKKARAACVAWLATHGGK